MFMIDIDIEYNFTILNLQQEPTQWRHKQKSVEMQQKISSLLDQMFTTGKTNKTFMFNYASRSLNNHSFIFRL